MSYRKFRKVGGSHPCPTCKRPTLSDFERSRGYQCIDCTRRAESEWG